MKSGDVDHPGLYPLSLIFPVKRRLYKNTFYMGTSKTQISAGIFFTILM